MNLDGTVALVTGGASGLGAASAARLIDEGARVVILDLPASRGKEVAAELGPLATFAPGDVAEPDDVEAAVRTAEGIGPLRALVHCAGIGNAIRLVGRDGTPGTLEDFTRILRVNLVGTYNVLRLAAASMAKNEEIDGERGACVLTASVAAFDGQIGQIAYSASKGGVAAMTLVAARDLANRRIRVCTIAPGLLDTPLLGRLREDIRLALAATVPNPQRLGQPAEYADLATTILRNAYLNGETIRLDGALRMAPR
ncbi:SDR family NAD(P)-dependent oxidoreductase [Pseudofrankia inefficax]|uniref:Short-chain dehydrogenase/reductase SDR n=1 Tax=Pseudofrankia inefficax (strain DSM 45817 / CECT 9037 / DDB 130130 / EuI1c) TaxID=298654 RepID=E3IU53_PSEI1|nr:SDR family NAD(P)-dependent oxidoreductase [Pseudofrankia inefficax]ADP81246.1 short-chain dehydrogenase/reductase SDR [Pseudofrankia inefficax]